MGPDCPTQSGASAACPTQSGTPACPTQSGTHLPRIGCPTQCGPHALKPHPIRGRIQPAHPNLTHIPNAHPNAGQIRRLPTPKRDKLSRRGCNLVFFKRQRQTVLIGTLRVSESKTLLGLNVRKCSRGKICFNRASLVLGQKDRLVALPRPSPLCLTHLRRAERVGDIFDIHR